MRFFFFDISNSSICQFTFSLLRTCMLCFAMCRISSCFPLYFINDLLTLAKGLFHSFVLTAQFFATGMYFLSLIWSCVFTFGSPCVLMFEKVVIRRHFTSSSTAQPRGTQGFFTETVRKVIVILSYNSPCL